MPLTTNTSPYWDDYKDDKQFYRILFRPGYAVQARELTQLQTNLQKQIERHGKHVFTHGSRVLDGQVAFNKCDHIKLSEYEENDPTKTAIDVDNAYSKTTLTGIKIGLDATTAGNYTLDSDGEYYVTDDDGTIRKPVAQVILASPREATDPPTLLINYESGDEFRANDHITKIGSPTTFTNSFKAVVNTTVTITGNAVGRSSYAAISEGVYFVTASSGGYFAHVPKQKIILDKYSDSPTYKVGLNITESIVTEDTDGTLYDNAQGTYTTYAPGAHRLKVALDLAKSADSDGIKISPAASKDFVELLRVENGQRAYSNPGNQDPLYNILGDQLAQRTYDESGNYVVDDFDCRVEDAGSRVKVTVQPIKGKTSAKAYIRGHEYEQAGPWVEYIERARKTDILKNVTTPLNHGAYVLVDNLKAQAPTPGSVSYLDTGRMPALDLHSVNTYAVDSSTAPRYNSTLVGRFRLRDIVPVTGNTYALYMTDFENSPAITSNGQSKPILDVEGNGASGIKVATANTSAFNDAYIGAKITITHSWNHPDFAGQTRTIVKSTATSSGTNTVYVDRPFDQPSSNTHFPGVHERFAISNDLRAAATGNGSVIASGVNDFTKALGSAAGNFNIGNKTAANAEISKFGTIANTSIVAGGTHPGLIFKMPVGGARWANGISKSATGNNITLFAKYSQSVAATSSQANFNVTNFRNQTGFNTGKIDFATADKNAYVVINETTGRTIDSGDYTLTLTSWPNTIRITSPYIGTTDVVRLIAPVKLKTMNPKIKTLRQGVNIQGVAGWGTITTNRIGGNQNNHVVFATPNRIPGEKDNLGVPDVYRIVEVIDSGALETAPTYAMLNNSNYRVTANYDLDMGQSEDLYDYASIVLKAGAKPPLGQIAVVYDSFAHSTDDESTGFFSPDSYHGQILNENIPRFISSRTGQRYELREFLDFRPVRKITGNADAAANTNYFVPIVSYPSADQTAGTYTGIVHPDSQGSAIYDLQYFVPRFDKVILSLKPNSAGGNSSFIKIVTGDEDQSPALPPRVDEADMTLFTLSLPSYTPRAKDISILKESNRRWTMKDISKINKRIDRLEYYSSLNLIEQDLTNINIFDRTGQIERFKHGFLVDTFETGTALADLGNPGTIKNLDFQASIGRGVLRPAVETENIPLNFDALKSTKVQATGGVLHLPYTTVSDDAFLQQVRATQDGAENINPFQVQTFQGSVELTPKSDIWKSTIDGGEYHIDTSGAKSALSTLVTTLNAKMGPSMTQWSEWEDEWFGTETVDAEYSAKDPTGAFQRVLQDVPMQAFADKITASQSRAWGFSAPIDYDSDKGESLNTSYGVENTDFKTFWEAWGEDEGSYNSVPLQTHIFDDEIATVTKTQSVSQARKGEQTQFRIADEQIVIGEFVVNSNQAQYMRPCDITFRISGLKPNATMYPHFDDTDIRRYTERANELVLKNTTEYGHPRYQNPFGVASGREEILVGSVGGRGIAAGNYGNTVFLVNANGKFDVDSTVTGSIVGTPSLGGARKVVSYRHYSGTLQHTQTASTLQLDDSASNSGSWLDTSAGSRATPASKDLFGRTIYLVEGRGYGQSSTITAYDKDTNKITVSPSFTVTPNTQTRYSISDHTTSPAGQLVGVFHVPNYNWANALNPKHQEAGSDVGSGWSWQNAEADEKTNDTQRFLTGNKEFRVQDSLDKNQVKSFGTGHFQASGIIETRMKHVQDVFGLETITKDITDTRMVTNRTVETYETGNQIEVGSICWADPLAQSILVDPHKYPEGIFIDSVDIWFKAKPDESVLSNSNRGLPVTLQIRPNVGGVPSGGHVLASSVRYPDDINISAGSVDNVPSVANTATSTNFKFTHPIHLAGGNEYSVVLLSDSIEYEVWTAKVGSNEVGTGGETGVPAVTIDSQPHMGSMFKSQNGSTWQPEVNQDMMFRIHKCKFETGSVGSAIFRSANAMSHYTPSFGRVLNPLSHVNLPAAAFGAGSFWTTPYGYKFNNMYNSEDGGASPNGYIYHRFRVDATELNFPSGFTKFEYAAATKDDSDVPNVFTLDPTTGYTQMQMHRDVIPSSSLKILQNKTGSFVFKGTISSDDENISPMINLERLSLTMIRNLINDGQLYANTWPMNFISTDAGGGATGQNLGGGFRIETSGRGYAATDTVTITTPDSGQIGSGATGKPIVNGTGAIVGVTLHNAGNNYLTSPTIAVSRAGAGSDAVVKYHGEDEPDGPGNYLARYMTKKVVMSPGAEATDVKVYLTASQPRGTKVHVYVKVKNKSDVEPFEKKKWQLLSRNQAFSEEVTPSEDIMREISFSGLGAGDGGDGEYPLSYDAKVDGVAVAADEGPTGERFNTFNAFAIKIVMQSNDPRLVPVVSNMRAIAIE